MTKEEILNIENLKVAESTDKFIHIHAKDGYYITKFKEGDDIKAYYGAVCIYSPIMEEYPEYRTITAELHKIYTEEKVKQLKSK